MDGMIERAVQGDLAEILELQKKAFAPVAADAGMDIPPMVQTYESIAGEYETGCFLKYALGGRIVGSVRGYLNDTNVCQVCRLIVDPDCQNKGIGTILMGALEEAFPDCEGYALFTGAGHYNKKAIALYTKLGYRLSSEKELDGVPMVYMDKPNGLTLRRAEERDLGEIQRLYHLATEWMDSQGIHQWNAAVYPTYETARRGWEDGHLYCIGGDPVAATMILNDIEPHTVRRGKLAVSGAGAGDPYPGSAPGVRGTGAGPQAASVYRAPGGGTGIRLYPDRCVPRQSGGDEAVCEFRVYLRRGDRV